MICYSRNDAKCIVRTRRIPPHPRHPWERPLLPAGCRGGVGHFGNADLPGGLQVGQGRLAPPLLPRPLLGGGPSRSNGPGDVVAPYSIPIELLLPDAPPIAGRDFAV